MKKSVALHGAVYGRNFGDILIIETVLRFLFRCGISEVSIPMGFERFIGYINRNSRVIGTVRYPSVIIFGPGGYLGQPKYNTLRWNIRFMVYHGFIILASCLFRIPVIVHGTGVGPATFYPVRLLMKLLFMRAVKIHVRDIESFKYVTEIYSNVDREILTFGGDVALALPFIYDIEPINNQSVAGVIGIHMPVGNKIYFPDALAEDLIKFVEENKNYQFKILHDGPGHGVHAKLKGLLSFENVVELDFDSPEGLLSQLNQCEVVFSTKLHVGICAYALGKKVVSIYTHPKNVRFFQQIKRSDNAVSIAEYQVGWLQRIATKTFSDIGFHDELSKLSSQVISDLEALNREVAKINGK